MAIINPGGTGTTYQFPPGHEIGYTQITAPVSIVSTTEATGTTIISPGALTFDGGLVLVHFFAPYVTRSSSGVSTELTINLFESTTEITRFVPAFTDATANQNTSGGVNGFYRFTPTAGSHTYTVTAWAQSTTGTPAVGAGAGGTTAFAPAFIRFTKV